VRLFAGFKNRFCLHYFGAIHMAAKKKVVYCDFKGEERETCKSPAFWKCMECGRPLCSKHAFAMGQAECECGCPDLERVE